MTDHMEVLIVGSNSGVGGIQRYIDQQDTHLPGEIRTEIYDTEVTDRSGTFGFVLGLLQTIWGALLFPLQRRPDIVHVHTAHRFSFYRAAFYVLFSTYLWRRPVVLHVHGSCFDEFLRTDSRFVTALQTVVFDACDVVVALSEYWRELIDAETSSTEAVVLPNAVDACMYTSDPGGDPPTVVYISHLIERKGVVAFSDVVDRMASSVAPVEFHIAGDGDYADRVEKLADTYENVYYHGYVSEEDKRDLLEQGSIFVLPSHAEGLPIAILEAMTSGNAIVSTTVGSIPELIDEENGRLVEPGATSSLEDELESLVDDPDVVEQMGVRNRSVVEEQYDWRAVSWQLSSLYRRLLDS